MKNMNEIALGITEEEYRSDPALSYSTLAKYEREGFNNLEHLFDRADSPSLTFGSAVDALITGGEDEFNSRFIVAEFPVITDSVVKVVKALFVSYGISYRTLESIPVEHVIEEATAQGYQLNWKPETRVRVIVEKGSEYYSLMHIAQDKTLLDTETYQDVLNCVRALKESEATKFYFTTNDPFDESIRRYYQLKFKAVFNGIEYKCMSDLLIVDNKAKTIQPVDLKTSSHAEWDFHKSFIQWNYQIQARLYWNIIRRTLDSSEEYKDYKLLDYKFIVINRKTLTPLVWDCPFTQALGTLHFGREGNITMRDPFEIGEELYHYLNDKPKVPMGINNSKPNNLKTWLNKL